MTDSVFVPSFGNRPRSLVGREDVLLDFEYSLKSEPGSRERAIILLGQRGYGKTVLLLEFAQIARQSGYIATSPTIVSKDMNLRILEKLNAEAEAILPKSKPSITGGNISVLGFGAGIQLDSGNENKASFAMQLTESCRYLNREGYPILILIDEVQANNEELRQLIVAYQEMVGEGLNVSIVLAGLPAALSSVLNDHVLTFLNRAMKKELSPLRTNDIILYYTRAFDALGIKMTDGLVYKAADKTFGSPYMMQLIGHYITTLSDENSDVSENMFNRALSMAESDFKNDICKTTLAVISDRDIDFLVAMSCDEQESSLSDISNRMGVTDSFVQTYKRRLIQSGIIEQHRRGKVRYAVPYLRDYLIRQGDIF